MSASHRLAGGLCIFSHAAGRKYWLVPAAQITAAPATRSRPGNGVRTLPHPLQSHASLRSPFKKPQRDQSVNMQRTDKYPRITRWLHRITALTMIFMIALGWYLSVMQYESPSYNILRQLHRTLGLLLFPLGLAHAAAYTCLPRPAFSAHLKTWEKKLAKLVHLFLLYVVIAIPVAGYFMSGDHLVILGKITIPAYIELTKDMRKIFFSLHEILAWATAAIVVLHAAAALKHQIVDKDISETPQTHS